MVIWPPCEYHIYLYIRNEVTTRNLKYANSSSNYYVIMMVKFFENSNRKSRFFSHPRYAKCRVEANNNRFAVVVCARHVVTRLSKRSALVYIYIHVYTQLCFSSKYFLEWERKNMLLYNYGAPQPSFWNYICTTTIVLLWEVH